MSEKFKCDCEDIILELMRKRDFLNPNHSDFDIWDNNDAAEAVADLISLIRRSDHIDQITNKPKKEDV